MAVQNSAMLDVYLFLEPRSSALTSYPRHSENYLASLVGLWLPAHNPFLPARFISTQPRATRLCPGVKGGSPAVPGYLSQSLIFFSTHTSSHSFGLFHSLHTKNPSHNHFFLSGRFSCVNCKSNPFPQQGQCALLCTHSHTV